MKRPPSAHRFVEPNKNVSKARKIRGGGKWKRYRKQARKRYGGACALCIIQSPDTRPRDAVDVHHIQRLSDRADLAFDPANTVPLCRECHGEITTMENGGDIAGARAVFDGWIDIIEESEYA